MAYPNNTCIGKEELGEIEIVMFYHFELILAEQPIKLIINALL
jgi:hypothetical protein